MFKNSETVPYICPVIYPKPPLSLIGPPSIAVRNERNLQQKQQLAGGPMSHDALHGEYHARPTPYQGCNDWICTDGHGYRPVCSHSMDKDSHGCIDSPPSSCVTREGDEAERCRTRQRGNHIQFCTNTEGILYRIFDAQFITHINKQVYCTLLMSPTNQLTPKEKRSAQTSRWDLKWTQPHSNRPHNVLKRGRAGACHFLNFYQVLTHESLYVRMEKNGNEAFSSASCDCAWHLGGSHNIA